MSNRGSMFVLSKNQFDQVTAGLSDRAWRSSGERARAAADATTTLLDLGAGDGRPTLAMSAGFDRVVATEVSQPMQRLLVDKGFHVVAIDQWVQPVAYDMIREGCSSRLASLSTSVVNPDPVGSVPIPGSGSGIVCSGSGLK